MESFIEELETQRVAVLSAYLTESGYNNYELSSEELCALRKFGTLKDEKWGTYKIGKILQNFDIGKMDNMTQYIASNLVYMLKLLSVLEVPKVQ